MIQKRSRLSLAEWQTLFEMEARGESIQRISKILGREEGNLKAALKRYPLPWHQKQRGPLHKALHSFEQARQKRSAPRKRERLKSKFIQEYAEQKLRAGLSPQLIAGRLKREYPEHSISHEAIYQWIFEERQDLKGYLLRAGKPKRGRAGARAYRRRPPAAPKKSIELRPVPANERTELGHAESDLIVSAQSEVALLVAVDRRSRKVRLRKVRNRQAETVKAALVAMMICLPSELRRTLTQDNGSEHALHQQLEAVLGISVFFCHPYSASERGTVENRNGLIRRYFPKGTDFATVSDEEVKRIEDIINSRPMAILDFMTPEEFEAEELMKLAA
jgi:IS30 family transposase